MKYTRTEQETTIRWDEEEKQAHIYTASPVAMRKLDKLAHDHPDVYVCIWSDADGKAKRYQVNARYIRFGKPSINSEAQREARRKNVSKMNARP